MIWIEIENQICFTEFEVFISEAGPLYRETYSTVSKKLARI